MVFSNIDRTVQVENLAEVSVNSTDHCIYFEKHPYTYLLRKECWTCRYGDFGIETGNPTIIGRCRYQELCKGK